MTRNRTLTTMSSSCAACQVDFELLLINAPNADQCNVCGAVVRQTVGELGGSWIQGRPEPDPNPGPDPDACAPQFLIMESGVMRVELRLLDSASHGGEALRQRLPPDLLREAPARSGSASSSLVDIKPTSAWIA